MDDECTAGAAGGDDDLAPVWRGPWWPRDRRTAKRHPALAYELTQGQPRLVNALARRAVMEVEPDPAIVVTPEHILTTKEILIQRQDTHLDSLAERLRELRVRRVIEPMLAGRSLSDVPQDDIRFLVDLGTFRFDGAGGLVIANPIYREALPRVLANTTTAKPAATPAGRTITLIRA